MRSRGRQARWDGVARRLHAASARRPALRGRIAWVSFLTVSVVAHTRAGSPAVAVARYWAWQLWRRVVRRPVVVELPVGGRLLVPVWSQSGGLLVATGFTEPADQLLLARLLGPGDVLVDVGANIGMYSVAAACGGAEVVAFEPMARAAAALRRSADLTGGRVAVREEALADFTGTASFSSADAADVGAHLGGAGGPVAVSRLDDLALPGTDGLVVLKIDVEGHDAEVLRGGLGFLRTHRPVVLVEVWDGSPEVVGLLEEAGYAFHRPQWCPDGSLRLEELAAAAVGSGNLAAVPPELLGVARARAARPTPVRVPTVRWREAG